MTVSTKGMNYSSFIQNPQASMLGWRHEGWNVYEVIALACRAKISAIFYIIGERVEPNC